MKKNHVLEYSEKGIQILKCDKINILKSQESVLEIICDFIFYFAFFMDYIN